MATYTDAKRLDRVRDRDEDLDEERPARHRDNHKHSVVDESLQRSKYGGFNFGAAFFGWLVATGMAALLLGLLSAFGGGYLVVLGRRAVGVVEHSAAGIGLGSAIATVIILALAYYAGGYVAGRMSRFNGAKQGIGVWIIGAVLATLLAIVGGLVGSNLDAVRQISLPNIPLSGSEMTTGGILTLLMVAALTFLAAMLGGKVGEAYHRKVDRAGNPDR